MSNQAVLGDNFKVTPTTPTANPAKSGSVPIPAQPQQTTPPSPVAVPQVVDADKADLDKRFNALVAKERSLSQKAQQISKQNQEYTKRIAALEEQLKGVPPVEQVKTSTINDLKARALANPLEAMKELGLTYEQLTQFVLNDNRPTPELVETRLQQEITSIKNRLEAEQKARDEAFKTQQLQMQEQSQRQYAEAANQVKLEITDFVSARPDDFALIQKNEASETVFEVMNQHYNNTGRIMNIEEACKLVEEYFEEQALDLFKVAKLQAKLGSAPKSTPASGSPSTDNTTASGQSSQEVKTKPKWVPSTLTHQLSTEGAPVRTGKEKLTYEQRKAMLLQKYGMPK
jgi:hypothetical protein